MADDVFRFMTVRPAQRTTDSTDTAIHLFSDQEGGSELYQQLAAAAERGSRRAVLDAANAFEQSDDFVDALDQLQTPIHALDLLVVSRDGHLRNGERNAAIVDTLEQSPSELAASPEFASDKQRLADSLLAVTAARARYTRSFDYLVRGIRLCALIDSLSANSTESTRTLLTRPVFLPSRIIGARLNDDGPENDPHPPPPPARDDEWNAVREKILRLKRMQAAIEQLRDVHEFESPPDRDRSAPPELPPSTRPARRRAPAGESSRTNEQLEEVGTGAELGDDDPRFLSAAATRRLPSDTRALLGEVTAAAKRIDVPETVTRLEREIYRIASDIFLPQNSLQPLAVGSLRLSRPELSTRPSNVGPSLGDVSVPPLIESPTTSFDEEPSAQPVPSSAGTVRPAGIADLLVVRQEPKLYEPGELAHVENVLRGEHKERTHRRAHTSEEVVVRETEQEEETERDLQSTERFELQREASEVIKEDMKADAGVTVTANYGPSVQVTADFNFAYERAREESARTSSTFARSVTDRSVSRVRERQLQRRTTRTVEEVEETSKHGVDNAGGEEHVVGVYRWIDKIYKAQIVNYGRRMLLQILVPEPAAFCRFTQQNKPVSGVTIEKPDPPGFYAGTTFIPLSPTAITPAQYLYWVGKYGAEGVEPPPPMFSVMGVTLEKPYGDRDPYTKVSTELKVPEGYVAKSASATYTGWVRLNEEHYAALVIGNRLLNLGQSLSTPLASETQVVPLGMQTGRFYSIVVNVEVICQRTDHAYQKWQMRTYEAIMTAYDELRQRYEGQIAAAEVQQGVAIRGRNPLINREIERTELKKSALSILTAQHFDLFNAMSETSAEGFPEMNFAETEAEGSYVQFFEQGLEWKNMTYVHYPYFWGRKSSWPMVSQLEDPDPLFTLFLQAGFSRVQVPVRPGFEEAILHFLESGGVIWNGGDPPHIDDELYVSMVQEIREQTGENFMQGAGTISVTNDDVTVSGTDTTFSAADRDREIRIAGEVYRIDSVPSPSALTLAEPYRGATDTVPYSLGAVLVGEPWDVRLPTTLVMLQRDATLPDWTTQ